MSVITRTIHWDPLAFVREKETGESALCPLKHYFHQWRLTNLKIKSLNSQGHEWREEWKGFLKGNEDTHEIQMFLNILR